MSLTVEAVVRGDDQPFPCIECGEQVANFVSSVLLIDATLSGSVRKVSSPLDPERRRTLGGRTRRSR